MRKPFIKSNLALAISLASTSAMVEAATEVPDGKQGIETVIVTGQKLERSIQDTRESVEVFTGSDLEQRNLTDLTDVIQQTPGVTGDQFGFRIRGVRNSDGASQPNRGDLASVVIDGVTTSGWVKSETVGQLWDVSQVEILRGPQSTNLGRNALAGAVVVNTQDPLYEHGVKVRMGYGNYGTSEVKAAANINVADGVSALRFSYEDNNTDGYIDNPTLDRNNTGARSNKVYRMKWLFEPVDELKMVFSYQHLENIYGVSRILLGDYDAEDRISLNNTQDKFRTEADLISLNVDYTLNDAWSLKSISAYQDGERFRRNDVDLSAQDYGNGGGIVVRNSEDNNWSQELRFTFESDTVRGSSGVYYTEIEAKRHSETRSDINLVKEFNAYAASQGIPMPLGTLLTNPLDLSIFLGPGAPVLPTLYTDPFFGREQEGYTNVDTTSWAAFTEWEMDFSDAWTVSFGVRYDEERQKYETASVSTSPDAGTLPGLLAAPIGTSEIIPGSGITLNSIITLANFQLSSFTANVPHTEKTKRFDNILPHAGVSYHWNEDVTTSFFVKKSYRSGGSELTLTRGINNFDAEELLSYEFSLRSVVLDGDGVFNANVYYSDWKDQQVAVQEPGTSSSAFTMTVNAGESTLYGAELKFDYSLNDDWDLYVGGALSHTEYEEFESVDGSEDYSGNEFTFAPKHTLVAGFTYQNNEGFFVNANANYAGKAYSDVENENELKGRTLVNLSGGYELDGWRFEAYAKNLFDKTYATNNAITDLNGGKAAILGAPRLVGVRATLSL